MKALPAKQAGGILPAWWDIAKLWFAGPDRWNAWRYAGVTAATSVALTVLLVWVSYAQRNFSTALSAKDQEGFYAAVWQFVGVICLAAPMFAADVYAQQRLTLAWRQHLTQHLLGAYFSDRAFFRLKLTGGEGAQVSDATASGVEGVEASVRLTMAHHHRGGREPPPSAAAAAAAADALGPPIARGEMDNPDQRITEDVAAFVDSSVRLAVGVLFKLLNCVAFAGVLWTISPALVVTLFAYAAAGTAVSTCGFGRPLMRLHYRLKTREADLRFVLMRVRENAESIAFYRGERRERDGAAHCLAVLVETALAKLRWLGIYELWTNTYGYATILAPSLVVAPRYFRGEVEFGVINQASFAFQRISAALSVIVNNIDALSGLAAETERLAALLAALERARSEGCSDDISGGGGGAGARSSGGDEDGSGKEGRGRADTELRSQRKVLRLEGGSAGLQVERLTASTPGQGQVVALELSFSLNPGESLLILGPSGCGKSSLLRLLAGLWSDGRGTVHTPPVSSCFFLPQKPFMPLASLREQLLFPSGGAAGAAAAREEGSGALTMHEGDDERTLLMHERWGRGGSGGAGGDAVAVVAASDQQLLELLKRVQLGDLAGRLARGLDATQDWAHVLSVGEQQRIAFARLLLHRPQLACLDEATAALDAATEAQLYAQLRGSSACYVSVGHRLQLLQHHTHVLQWRGPGQWLMGSAAELQKRLAAPAAGSAANELHLM